MNLVRNQRGQVAIFIAFIFQILFVFFAMLVNVGLLVHHKINLQNSADMAAYYGAMRQAEILNAMAHVNYQIRQSWKLLAWRYRMLGTFGDTWQGAPSNTGIHPVLWSKAKAQTAQIGPFSDEMSPLQGTAPGITNPQSWFLRPVFCVAHEGFDDWPAGENLCKLDNNTLAGGMFNIVNPTPPPVRGGLIGSGVSGAVSGAIIEANLIGSQRCTYAKYSNYYLLGLYAVSFQMDVAVRRATFKKLYSLLTNDGPGATQGFSGNSRSTFRDLNGEDVALGVLETLKRNLTEPNRAFLLRTNNASVRTYNSLTDPNCGFDQAYTENYIFPHMYYSSSACTAASGSANTFFAQHLSINPANDQPGQNTQACNPGATTTDLASKACAISQYIYQTNPAEIRMSLGFNRDHRCSPYYAVRVQATPSIPFLPNTGVNLVAESYTQAFGGSMGPWWASQPDSGDPSSITDGRMAKKDVAGPGGALTITASTEGANYSKYPGDERGLQSPAQLTFYGLELINRLMKGPNPFRIQDWNPLLTADAFLSTNAGMRELEISAVAPDLYDTTYYSIEPDFYRQYYLRMISPNVLGPSVSVPGWGSGGGSANFNIRPDLGSEKDASGNFPEFSVRNQLEVQERLINGMPQGAVASGFTNPRNRMAGSLASQANTLTSWNVYRIGDYTQDTGDQTSTMWTQKFGRCEQENGIPVTNNYKAVPSTVGNCLSGGRTGFSVRIVSKKYLTESLDSVLKNRLPAW